MSGIIIANENYTYEGQIVDKEPHGKGTFYYTNGDKYIGECRYSQPDGYGYYYYSNGSYYQGFFSCGKFNGIGTFENKKSICKGHWRGHKKHGIFYLTQKSHFTSFQQQWRRGHLIKSMAIQYMSPNILRTTRDNPRYSHQKKQKQYQGQQNKKCNICYDLPVNAVNDACGHVATCIDCLKKCDRCPICRAPIKNIIKLFIN